MAPTTASARLVLTDSRLFRESAYIDGAWVAAGASAIAVDNPASGEIIGHVPRLGAAETRRAIDAAARRAAAGRRRAARSTPPRAPFPSGAARRPRNARR